MRENVPKCAKKSVKISQKCENCTKIQWRGGASPKKKSILKKIISEKLLIKNGFN